MGDYSKFDNLTTFVCIQGVEKKPQKKNPEKFFYAITGYTRETQENFSANTFHASFVADTERKVTFSVKGEYLNIEPAKEGDEKAEEPKAQRLEPEPGAEKSTLKRQDVLTPEVVDQSPGVSMMLLHKAEIDTAIATAHAFPRSLTKFIETAMSYATYDAETAAGCSYALPRGGKLIEGPSVRLAEIVCSTYGNIRAEGRVMEITQDEVIARGVCMDLETNNTQTSEVRVKIKDKSGVRYNQDMITMTGNQAVAKARRNAIFMVVPGVFTKKIREAAKKVAAGDEKTLPQRRDAAVAFFKNLKVTEAQICEVLGVRKIGDITLEHYAILASMAQQIQNKENTVEEIFSKQTEDDLRAARESANEKLQGL